MGQVKNFDADFGGTEIFEPLQEIFKQIKQTEKKTKTPKPHVYYKYIIFIDLII